MTNKDYERGFKEGYEKARQEFGNANYNAFVKDIESDRKHRVEGDMIYEKTSYGAWRLIGYWHR